MNILLATYSYYPYNYGGTEVYVAALASFLKKMGHEVTIVAGMPDNAFVDNVIFYEDDNLKTVEYYFESVRVIGVVIKDKTTTMIYKKFSSQLVHSWQLTFKKIAQKEWDILHMHANTAAIGESLIKGVKLHSGMVKVIASYHLPISCAKGTLMFANSMNECQVKPSVNICTACLISNMQNWPISIIKKSAALIPILSFDILPTAIRAKFLVREFINSFNSFDREVVRWHVFSEQINLVLQINGIQKNKISLLRHGANLDFFEWEMKSLLSRKEQHLIIFLYAGRFDKVKGFYTLLLAWASLQESKERQLWIVGEMTNEEENVKYTAALSDRADVKWLGTKSQQELAHIMKMAHCVIIPSEWIEIGPLVFHEAIAAGSDVIASNIGGCKELAQFYNSKSDIFEAGNVESLSKAILKFNYSGTSATPPTQLQNFQLVLQSYREVVNN